MSIRTLVKDWLLKRGAIISRPPGQFSVSGYKFAAAKARGLEIGSAIDGGAANGDWTREVRANWPAARVLAVEPRDEVQGNLERVKAELGDVTITRELLGEAEGEMTFYVHGDRSSVNKDFAGDARAVREVRVPVTTIDRLVERHGFPGPDLIKLDLQGAELSALRGATAALSRAKAVLVEVSFIDFVPGMPVIADVFAFMAARGFAAYDILGLWHRPLDGALAQGDVMFVRADSPLRADRRYSPDDPVPGR